MLATQFISRDSVLLDIDGTQGPIQFVPKYFDLKELVHVYNNSDAVGIFFCGAITVLMFFILLLYVRNRENIYLYYVLFLFFMLLYGSIHIEASSWFNNKTLSFLNKHKRLVEPVTILSFSYYIFFTTELLGLRAQNIKIFNVLKIWGISCCIYAISYFIFYEQIYAVEHRIFLSARAIIFPLSLFCLIWIQRAISSPVKVYFMVGSVFYFIGAVVATLRYSVPNIPFENFYLLTAPVYFELGILIETLCFALALGERIYFLHIEKQRANEKLIQQLYINEQITRSQNEKLTAEVKEISDEISLTQQKLEKQKQIRVQAEYEKNLAEAEMLVRRLQINPHFLFNNLNAIKYLIQRNQSEKAVKYLVIFSRFVRKVLETSQSTLVPLSTELEIIKDFLELEKNRFGDGFTYTIDAIDDNIQAKILLPPLLLQPFVENAIWHGLLTSSAENKNIRIGFKKHNATDVEVFIDDNGVGRKKAGELASGKLHKNMGMFLTEERIKLFNNSFDNTLSYRIIDKTDNNGSALGTQVIVKLSIKT